MGDPCPQSREPTATLSASAAQVLKNHRGSELLKANMFQGKTGKGHVPDNAKCRYEPLQGAESACAEIPSSN